MPSEEYRLWELDIEKEERRSRVGSLGEIEDDYDFGNDFVIIDRPDMKKYNAEHKL
jgi:hypothetical protein